MNLDTPSTGKGVMIVAGLGVILLIFLYTTGVGAFLLGAAVVVALLYVLYVVLYRINRRLKRGRLRPRSGGEE